MLPMINSATLRFSSVTLIKLEPLDQMLLQRFLLDHRLKKLSPSSSVRPDRDRNVLVWKILALLSQLETHPQILP